MKRSGKTRLLKLIAFLSEGGFHTQNLTEAVLFRFPSKKLENREGIVLCIDEAEMTNKQKSDLIQLINSIYKRGVKVLRMRKDKRLDDFVSDEFDLFFPLALANIEGLTSVLEDRCITIMLERSLNDDIINKSENFDVDYHLNFIKKHLFNMKVSVSKCNISVYKSSSNTSNVSTYVTSVSKFPQEIGVELLRCYNYVKKYINLYIPKTHGSCYTSYTLDENFSVTILDLFKLDVKGRNFELFLPLLTLAYALRFITFNNQRIYDDNFVFEINKMYAETLKQKIETEIAEDLDTSILIFIAGFLSDKQLNEYTRIKDISDEFNIRENKHISNDRIGRTIKRLIITKDRRRLSKGVEYLFDLDKIKNKIKALGLDTNQIQQDYIEFKAELVKKKQEKQATFREFEQEV